MPDVAYRQIAELTDAEIEAARAYGAESGFFHLACQADHSMALAEFRHYQDFLCSGKLAALASATRSRCELTGDVTLYSGHENDAGVVGSLGHNDPARFVGLTWQYRGFTSTSSRKDEGEEFIYTRVAAVIATPVFMEFYVPAGVRLLPMKGLAGLSHEAEFLIPPRVPFEIIAASRATVGKVQNVLHLVLARPST